MTLFRTALMATGIMLGAALASGASATTLLVTNVGVGNGDNGSTNATIAGNGTFWTTPILMTYAGAPILPQYAENGSPNTLVVFCDDLYHDVGVGGSSYTYTIGQVTSYTIGGVTTALSATTSNEMGQLADIGRFDFNHGNEAGAIAAQTAIWALEYSHNATAATVAGHPGTYFSDPDAGISTQAVLDLEGLHVSSNPQYAIGLIPMDGQQAQILGAAAVPEPATWAMMLLGFGGLGVAMRNSRRRQSAAATA